MSSGESTPDRSVQDAYDAWAGQYDNDENATRDLNAEVLREQLALHPEEDVLEIGCGTGLNTKWIIERAGRVVAADFSEGMLQKAHRRLSEKEGTLQQMDVTEPWPFEDGSFDCAVSTLVLEHVERLAPVFREAHRVLRSGGVLYLCELHPYRQLEGTQANFDHEASGENVPIEAFMHPVSECVNEGISGGFSVRRMGEWYGPEDDDPRLLSVLFEK